MGQIQFSFIFAFILPAIRDYNDVIYKAYDSLSNDINLLQLLTYSFVFIGGTIKFLVIYFFSFQWVRDLTYLPVLVPQIKTEILKEHFFLQPPQSSFFSFLEIPSYTTNKFVLGFLNSFFLCLPLSVGHIISTRRFLIQGLSAGIYANVGTICGQILLLICILFGGRFFIVPWYNCQPLNCIIGLILVVNIISDMATERSIRIITDKNILIKIFLLNFSLTWTEQSCIFQYFGNLTLGAEPTIIENFSSATQVDFILTHITYIVGILFGSCFFTAIFMFNGLQLSNLVVRYTPLFYSRWIQKLNKSLIILMVTFTCTSLPFYSFDYLVLSNLGVVSQDKVLRNTVFIPTKIQDNEGDILNNRLITSLRYKSKLDTDINLFDKGRYLMFDANDSFEQLNYHSENMVISRNTKKLRLFKRIYQYNVYQKGSRFFNKFFKKKKVKNSTKSNKPENLSKYFSTQKNLNLEAKKLSNNDNSKLPDAIASGPRFISIKKLDKFFENIINKNFYNRFVIHEEARKPYLEKKFRYLCSINPIYKLLLSTDIDFFLLRQPRSFALNPKQETELFQKRLILANYYDSLRYYNKIPYGENFSYFFGNSKSYADRVYNQQFKGTLKLVRRLFSITLNENPYQFEEERNPNSFAFASDKGMNFFVGPPNDNSILRSNLILKFDQPLYKKVDTKKLRKNQSLLEAKTDTRHSIFHEELRVNKKALSKKDEKQSNTSFIQLTNPIPFYVGWDEQLRKLVITNRLAPKYSANYSMKFPKRISKKAYPMLNKFIEKNRTIEFTAWPISEDIKAKIKNKSTISYTTLSSLKTDIQNPQSSDFNETLNFYFNEGEIGDENQKFEKEFGTVKNIPINIAKNVGEAEDQLKDIFPYTRGGFVWPGHSNSILKFQKFFDMIDKFQKS